MTPEQTERAAAALVAARKGAAIATLPADATPQSEADSYRVQDAVIAQLGEAIGGWKVGISPLGGHSAAPIFASSVHPSPASLPARGFKIIASECEIGFRFNRPLPPRATALQSRRGVCRRLAAPDDRGRRFALSGFPLGRPAAGAGRQPEPRCPGLRSRGDRVGGDGSRPSADREVTADGKPFADCTGLRAGTPIDLCVAAVNHASGRGGVAAGTVVTTGTHTGLVFTEPGAPIVADFGKLGRVEVSFPAGSPRRRNAPPVAPPRRRGAQKRRCARLPSPPR